VKRVPVWILGATLGSFAAGMNVGLVIPKVFAGDHAVATPEDQYVRDLALTYGLTTSQERSLRLVLQSAREQEMAVYNGAEASQLPPAIRTQVLRIRSKTEQRIRAVLDDRQRTQFDADSRPPDSK
jgi:hypothetical protein